MIELVMSLSLQAIVTPFFFFKVPLKKTSPSPIYFFNVFPLKFLCNPILKINISTEQKNLIYSIETINKLYDPYRGKYINSKKARNVVIYKFLSGNWMCYIDCIQKYLIISEYRYANIGVKIPRATCSGSTNTVKGCICTKKLIFLHEREEESLHFFCCGNLCDLLE